MDNQLDILHYQSTEILQNLMHTRTNSFNLTLSPYAQSVRKTTLSLFQTDIGQDRICRICLQECPYVLLCQCRGSSMIHSNCLKQFIVKGQGNIKDKSKCQICHIPFNLILNKKCQFTCKNVSTYFKTSALSSTLFIAFTILTIIYSIYCLHLNSLGVLSQNQQLVLLIVGICLIIVLLIVLFRWIYHYLFETIRVLVQIRPYKKYSIQLTQANLNQSQQYVR